MPPNCFAIPSDTSAGSVSPRFSKGFVKFDGQASSTRVAARITSISGPGSAQLSAINRNLPSTRITIKGVAASSPSNGRLSNGRLARLRSVDSRDDRRFAPRGHDPDADRRDRCRGHRIAQTRGVRLTSSAEMIGHGLENRPVHVPAWRIRKGLGDGPQDHDQCP